MAQRFGVARATWNRWENGHRFPDLGAVFAIAEHFSVDPAWLLFGGPVGQGGLPRGRAGADLLPIDEDERIVLTSYRRLDPDRQRMQLETIRALAQLAAREAREAKKLEKGRKSRQSV